MTAITLLWVGLPFFVGFSIYLLPQADRILAFGVSLASLAYATGIFLLSDPIELHLLDSFGVTLLVDDLSAFFILTNALVTAAVILAWPCE